MKELVVATNNAGKLKEIQAILPNWHLLTLKDIGFTQTIEEPFQTFTENAFIKAKTVFDFCDKNVMADDSGLCVDALNGRPGVDSAHFAGPHRSDSDNLFLLLNQMEGRTDRSAHYKAVISLIMEGQAFEFFGRCDGTIALEPKGDKGFGYDPIFIPDGYEHTFGGLDEGIKNSISHRGKALEKMIHFLKEQA